MSETHTVKVTFDKDLREGTDAKRFVRSCLEGNRSNSFARNVHVTVVDDE
jgi:hypothetical protein